MSIDNKVFPIYEGAQMRRRFTTEEEWKDWLRAHGAYGFRVAPYYSRCVVVFGADRYVETIKQLYGVDDSEFIDDAAGWVTDMGYFEADPSVHGVFLPDVRDEKIARRSFGRSGGHYLSAGVHRREAGCCIQTIQG